MSGPFKLKYKKSSFPFKSPLKGWEEKQHAHSLKMADYTTYDKATATAVEGAYGAWHGGGKKTKTPPTVKGEQRKTIPTD